LVTSNSAPVVATALTDAEGNFRFGNVKPGIYQLRAQVPGGRFWLDAGALHYALTELPDADRQKLANLDLRLAPFKKGRWKKYSGADGLPGNILGSLSFGPDDALWIGSLRGLTRFDGKEFVTFGREQGVAGSTAPNAMHQAPDGTIWFSSFSGLLRFAPSRRGPPERIAPPGLPMDQIRDLVGTADGAVWWRNLDALVRYDGSGGQVFTNLWPRVNLTGWDRRLTVYGNTVWLSGPGTGLVRVEGTNSTRFGRSNGLVTDDTGVVAALPDGSVWVALGEYGLGHFDGRRLRLLSSKDGLPPGTITSLYVSPEGRIWLGTRQGLVACYDGRSFVVHGNPLLSASPSTYGGGPCWDIKPG
ncbi:hypothetical protein EG829_31085, partial [bacterium]|nr:hypothetical protein [bacterium]